MNDHDEFRGRVLEHYISLGSGVHQPLSDADVRGFAAAYRFHLRDWIPAYPRSNWLDLACGQGPMLMLAGELGFTNICGVDISEEMLQSCRVRGLTVHRGDVLEYVESCKSDAWDVISAFDILEHFGKPDAHRLLREVHRTLVPEGICLVKVPNAASPWGGGVMAADLTHETAFTPESLENLAKLAGFRTCLFREVGPAPTSFIARGRRVLWGGLRALYGLASAIETGSPGRGIRSRIMLARLEK